MYNEIAIIDTILFLQKRLKVVSWN